MSYTNTMPFVTKKYFDLFKTIGNNLFKDFLQLLYIEQKPRFIAKSLERASYMIQQKKEEIVEIYNENNFDINDHEVWIDGVDNLQNGISLFCCSFSDGVDFLFFEPVTGIYYWSFQNKFYINQRPLRYSNDNTSPADNYLFIPESFQFIWFLKKIINKPQLHTPVLQKLYDLYKE